MTDRSRLGTEGVVEALANMSQGEIRDVLEEVFRRKDAPKLLGERELEAARVDTLDESVSKVMSTDRGAFALRVRDCRFLRNSIALAPRIGWEASLAVAAYVLSVQLSSSESLLVAARTRE